MSEVKRYDCYGVGERAAGVYVLANNYDQLSAANQRLEAERDHLKACQDNARLHIEGLIRERDAAVKQVEGLRGLLFDWAAHFKGPRVTGGPLSSLRERTDAALSAKPSTDADHFRNSTKMFDAELVELLAMLRKMVNATPLNDIDRGGVWFSTKHPLIKRIDAKLASLSTASKPAFSIGDRVQKKSGSEWYGVVVGTYSTTLTPEGYAVESENHAGSVQIYPVGALVRGDL